jgi:hypothetical protein
MSKNKPSQNRIQSILYEVATLFQQHTTPDFDRNKHPLAAEDNLDLAKVFALARGKYNKDNSFLDNAGAIKITANNLANPILASAVSQKIPGDPTATGTQGGNLGHSERRVWMQALNKYIPAGEGRRPGDDYTSNVRTEQEVEKYLNLFQKAASYKGILEEKEGNVGLWTERTPCGYGNNNCNTFVNAISPEGSNVGHTLRPIEYERAGDQATRLGGLYRQLQDSHFQHNRDQRERERQAAIQQQSTFTLPKPVPIDDKRLKPHATSYNTYSPVVVSPWSSSPSYIVDSPLSPPRHIYFSPGFSPQTPGEIWSSISNDPNILNATVTYYPNEGSIVQDWKPEKMDKHSRRK